MKDDKEYVDFLKNKGLSTQEIIYAVSLRNEGVAMTKAIYKFNELYDKQEIDGFPDSSIAILEMFYGKRLKRMNFSTLEQKVSSLQKCLDSNIDIENIKYSVNYYLTASNS
jgi:hypothetical protein